MLIAFLLAILLTTPATAHAYIDPGSGSFLLQMIIAGVLGLGVTLKIYWNRLFGRGPKTDDDDELDD